LNLRDLVKHDKRCYDWRYDWGYSRSHSCLDIIKTLLGTAVMGR